MSRYLFFRFKPLLLIFTMFVAMFGINFSVAAHPGQPPNTSTQESEYDDDDVDGSDDGDESEGEEPEAATEDTPETGREPRFVRKQVVVKLDLASGVTIEDINAEFGTTTREVLLASSGIYLLDTPRKARAAEGQLNADERIVYAELNYLVDTPEANPMHGWTWGADDLTVAGEAHPSHGWTWGGEVDEHLATQYALDLIDVEAGHAEASGAGVVVAVLDTGVQPDHPFLVDALVDGYDFLDDDADSAEMLDGIDNDEDGLIDEAAGHGTHVAGVVRMVAPDASIMPLRVLDSDGSGNLFLIAEAIEHAAANGADIINLSLGIAFRSKFLHEVIQDVTDDGVIVVAAAGNLGVDDKQYPAGFREVVAVTATDENGVRMDQANHGAWVDLAAPGKSIYSAYPIDGYAWWSGTSMATPFAAGAAALLLDAQAEADADTESLLILLVGEEWGSNRQNAAAAESIPFLDLGTIFAID